MNTMLFRVTVLIATGAIPISSFAHEVALHKKITETAALSSVGFESFLLDQLGSADAPFVAKPKLVFDPGVTPDLFGAGGYGPVVWLKVGSQMEDDEIVNLVGISDAFRTKNHFFDPTKEPAEGLTDGWDLFGIDSFTWASVANGGGSQIPNYDTWLEARNLQYTALTAITKAARDVNLAHALYSLGHVLHLNQDLSQPEHVRNDNHNYKLGPRSVIESHGLRTFAVKSGWFTPPPSSQSGWLYWRDAGFTRLEAFWDRNLYKGTATQMKQALDDDKNSTAGKQLGLAEFSNGNFLGGDAMYNETRFLIPKHVFPFPSVYSSTTFPQTLESMTAHEDEITYRDGTSGTHVYIRKNADGVSIPHHSRLTYLQTVRMANGGLGREFKTTIDDSLVLDDYHAILIPKAIKYSAGLLEYFFRGRIDVTITGDSQSEWTITVQNASGDTFKGGTLTVLEELPNGNRTQVQQAALGANETVLHGGTKEILITSAVTANAKYIVVYKGTIGFSDNSVHDAVDANRAIAAKSFPTHANEAFTHYQCIRGNPDIEVPHSIPAGVVFSAISVADANALATTWAAQQYPGNCN